MPVFATFDSAAYFGACPNVARTAGTPPTGSPLDKGVFGRLAGDCSCQDASFGGVIDLPPVNDDAEAYPKASVEARLDAFLAGRGATRTGAHATVTTAGSGYAWLTSDDKVAFISDGRLSLALQGEAEGLLDVEDDGLSGAERSAWSLLGYYYDHAESDLDVLKSEMVAGLSSLSGSWAFVLQDRKRHRVIAAASADGAVPLQWGETIKNLLMFSTTADSAIDETEASPFPPGCVFISSVADKLYDVTVNRACPGRLVSFTGALPGAAGVRRVRSRGALSRVTSGGDLRLIKTYAAGALRNTPSFSDLYGSANNLAAIADEV